MNGPTVQGAVSCINEALRRGDPRQTLRALMNPDAHLPDVYPFASVLYQSELVPLQRQSPEVCVCVCVCVCERPLTSDCTYVQSS